ncbi:hypothetical protein MHB77_30545 [Paenibacillus sp. FSL K6-3166]|uniref:hypothetical protein n=1 Tax=Paenibacillus sp. FSL K6-3166 TaxID=2921492 RepID=UPI0030F6408E
MLESMMREYMEQVEEIRTRFTDTDGEGWHLRDLKEYVNGLDEKTTKRLLRHFIIMEWNRKMEIREGDNQ